jgi:hypothetical protein
MVYDENDVSDDGLTPITYPVVGGVLHSTRVRLHTLRWDMGADGFYAFTKPTEAHPLPHYQWVAKDDPQYAAEVARIDVAYLALLEAVFSTAPEVWDGLEEDETREAA